MIETQLPLIPRYGTMGGVYESLHAARAVLPAETELNLGHRLKWRMRAGHKWDLEVERILAGQWERDTLLMRVHALPEHDAALFDLAGRPERDAAIDPNVFVNALGGHIAATWRPGGKHVVLMSAGYDSRLLVALLHDLWQQRGDEWLGECRFVCWEPECDDASTVIDWIVGLPNKTWPQCIFQVVRPSYISVDYDAPALAWDVVGRLSEPARFWGGPLLANLELADWLDDDTQGMTALWSDELVGYWSSAPKEGFPPVAAFLAAYMLDQPGIFPLNPRMEWIMPFASLGVVELLQRGTWKRCANSFDDWKRLLCNIVRPGLSALPNTRYRVKAMRDDVDGVHLPTQELSQATREAMQDAYAASWYASEHGPQTIEIPRYFDYTSVVQETYCKAAIVEGLMR